MEGSCDCGKIKGVKLKMKCSLCKKSLSKSNKSGYCSNCQNKRYVEVMKEKCLPNLNTNKIQCILCKKSLSKSNKSGYCSNCQNKRYVEVMKGK